MFNLFGSSTLGQLSSQLVNRRLGANVFGIDPGAKEAGELAKDKQFETDNTYPLFGANQLASNVPSVPFSATGGIDTSPVGVIAPEAQIQTTNQTKNTGIMGIIAGLI